MKLEGIAAYSAQTELNKPLATQTKQSTNSVTQNFEDDVVKISATATKQIENGLGWHPPEARHSYIDLTENHGSGWIPPEKTDLAAAKTNQDSNNTQIENGLGWHPPK